MSKRLQVVLDDAELEDIQRVSRAQHLTVAEWVRQALRAARREQPVYDVSTKIQVVREAARHDYPSGDIEDMLHEISRGRNDGLSP